jgi:hypothetical protein
LFSYENPAHDPRHTHIFGGVARVREAHVGVQRTAATVRVVFVVEVVARRVLVSQRLTERVAPEHIVDRPAVASIRIEERTQHGDMLLQLTQHDEASLVEDLSARGVALAIRTACDLTPRVVIAQEQLRGEQGCRCAASGGRQRAQ